VEHRDLLELLDLLVLPATRDRLDQSAVLEAPDLKECPE